jgi:hypothetical protein
MKDNLGKRNSFKDSGSEGGMIFSARNETLVSPKNNNILFIIIK